MKKARNLDAVGWAELFVASIKDNDMSRDDLTIEVMAQWFGSCMNEAEAEALRVMKITEEIKDQVMFEHLCSSGKVWINKNE